MSKEKEEFEESIIHDLASLDVKPDITSHTSDHFPKLVKLAKQMIKEGNAYMDNTDQETMREERMDGIDGNKMHLAGKTASSGRLQIPLGFYQKSDRFGDFGASGNGSEAFEAISGPACLELENAKKHTAFYHGVWILLKWRLSNIVQNPTDFQYFAP